MAPIDRDPEVIGCRVVVGRSRSHIFAALSSWRDGRSLPSLLHTGIIKYFGPLHIDGADWVGVGKFRKLYALYDYIL